MSEDSHQARLAQLELLVLSLGRAAANSRDQTERRHNEHLRDQAHADLQRALAGGRF